MYPCFQPFDKVLVRNPSDNIWKTDFFSNISNKCPSFPFRCSSGVCFSECIHYNELTAYLLGTTKDLDQNE